MFFGTFCIAGLAGQDQRQNGQNDFFYNSHIVIILFGDWPIPVLRTLAYHWAGMVTSGSGLSLPVSASERINMITDMARLEI